MKTFSRDEVEQHFRVWRRAIDVRDLDAMAQMLTPDALGGNAQFGIHQGRDAIIQFSRDRWPESVPNRSVWHAIDGDRVVNKWRETLPGEPPDGLEDGYDYDGISEFIYAGQNQWSFMYGIPDVTGLMRVHSRWRKDGQPKIVGDVYPGLS